MTTARFDVAPLLQVGVRLGRTGRQVAKMEQRAVGTLRRRMPVAARRDIQQEYALTATRINRGLRTANISGGVEIRASGEGIGLISFGARQTRQGVTYAIKRGQRELERGAFIRTPAASPKSGPQVFQRKPKGDGRVGRYPIIREHGPQIAQMLRRPDRQERLREEQGRILTAEIDRLQGSL